MPAQLISNNAYSTLSGSITNVQTSLAVQAAHGARFPTISGGDWFFCTLQDASNNIEIVKVTARSTDTFTIVRNQEGTVSPGGGWAADSIVELRFTAATTVSIDGAQTLTNKTVNLASNTLTGTLAQFNTAVSDADVASLAGTETLTNKTINLASNTLSATKAQLDAACSDDNLAYLATANTFTAKQTITNTLKQQQVLEKITVDGTVYTGTVNFDCLTQAIHFTTANATANWTINFRGDSGATLDSIMAVGESITVTTMVTMGTAYYNNLVWINGSVTGVTTRWQNSAPTSGDASSLNIYSYTIIKTGAATFTVLASKSKYA